MQKIGKLKMQKLGKILPQNAKNMDAKCKKLEKFYRDSKNLMLNAKIGKLKIQKIGKILPQKI